jgi:hypothetical protein
LIAFAVTGFVGSMLWIAWGGFGGPIQVLTFRSARGWQIESVIGAIVRVFSSARVRSESGADRVGYVAGWARWSLAAAGAALVSGIWVLVARIRHADQRVRDGLAPVHGERAVAALTLGIVTLSVIGLDFVKELNQGQTFPVVVVLVRNALLIALLCVAVARLWHLSRRSRPMALFEPELEEYAA